MTVIAVPIFVDAPDDTAAVLERARAAVAEGAGMIEWRIDLLAGLDAAEAMTAVDELVRNSPVPCIVTCRSPREGGRGGEHDRARQELLARIAELVEGPRYLDVELDTFETAEMLQASCRAARERSATSASATGLILSTHGVDGRPANLLQRIEAMSAEPLCSVVKVAWTARSLRDNLEAFDLLAERQRPMIALCMGDFGLMSRVLAPKFGGLLTFATDAPGAASAPGQPTLDELRRRYRFEAITESTRVYGVIGWPITHSWSPDLHNAGFAATGYDGVYLPLPVPPEYEHFKATVGSMVDHAGLGFSGASVTIPHKENLLRFVAERGGRIDPTAERVGAANTLLVGATGAIACTNTDAPAAVDALCDGMHLEPSELGDVRVAVLGAGGVARAVSAGLRDAGASVVVFGRSPDRVRGLVEAIQGGAGDVGGTVSVGRTATLTDESFDVYVNCTPIGMTGGPDAEGSPLPDDVVLDDSATVFDTVYNPVRTPLVCEAEARGARVVTGIEMFLRQAAIQFQQWTGRGAPMDEFRATLETL